MSKDTITTLVKTIIDGEINNDNIAKLFHLLYPTKFLYDLTNQKWYSINEYGIYHSENDDLQTARLLISEEFKNFIKNKYDEIWKKANNANQVRLSKILPKLISNLCNESPKKNIIGAMIKYYGKEKIYEQMDNVNKYVFAFNNGVWDLKNKCFRHAKPEKLITTTTSYDYVTPKQKYVSEIQSILDNIFPDKAKQTHTLKTIALCLAGINSM